MTAVARSWLAGAVIGASTALSLASAAMPPSNTVDDELLAMSNEFQLGNGQSKLIANAKHPEEYRVCVKQAPGVVPLQVTADGKVQTVNAGTCTNVNGATIKIAPGAKLATDKVLVGKYKRVSKT
jgi:hypothetical protein